MFMQSTSYHRNTSLGLGIAKENLYLVAKSQFIKIIMVLLQPLSQWLDEIEVNNANIAQIISKVIPAQCPFERDIILLGRKVGHIPPLCKLNPLYEQLVGLRFRALCYLAGE